MAAPDDDLLAWLAAWGRCVASVDFETAAAMFDPAVVGFGTRAEVALGLEELRAEQWGRVWPAITGFAFDVDAARTIVSDDRTQAAIWTTWSSAGRHGRATMVLRREVETGAWLGVHTHFSLRPPPG